MSFHQIIPPQLEERTGGICFIKKRGLLQNSSVNLNDINFKVFISNRAGVMTSRAKSHVTPSEGSSILPVLEPPFLTKIVIFKDINFKMRVCYGAEVMTPRAEVMT